MARLESWYKQDLMKPLVVHRHADIFNQDSKGNLIGVEVYSNGEEVTLAGTINGYCLLADGTTVPAVGATRSGNKASILIPQTAYGVPGPITITIKNVDGDNITTLCAVVGLVRPSISGNLVNPGSVVTDWSNSINAQLLAVQTAADNVGAIVASPFDESTVYVPGNYVTYNGNLYLITADHAAGDTWANTSKTQRNVGNELSNLKSALNESIESIIDGENLFDSANADCRALFIQTSNNTIRTTDSNRLVVVPIKQNTRYMVSCAGESTKRIATTVVEPANNKAASNVNEFVGAIDNYIVSNTTGNYLAIQLFIDTDADKTPENYYSSIVINEIAAKDATARADIEETNQALTKFRDAYSEYADIDITTNIVNKVITSSGVWSANRSDRSCVIKGINSDSIALIVKANSEYNAVIAFLKTNNVAEGSVPDYATGSTKTVIAPGTTQSFNVPDDANYVYIQLNFQDTVNAPELVKLSTYTSIPEVDDTLSVQGDAADANVVGNKFAEYDELLYTDQSVSFDGTGYGVFINTSNQWSYTQSARSFIKEIPIEAIRLTVKTQDNGENAVIAFLTTDSHSSGTPDYAVGTGRIALPPNITQTFTIPSDAKYLYIMKEISGVDRLPASAVYTVSKTADIDQDTVYLRLHEKPENTNILNIIKRCRQMTDIKWTPAVDLNRLMLVTRGGVQTPETSSAEYYRGTFKAGTEYTGVPYGRVSGTTDAYGIAYGTVGHYIGFDTFISSVSNPKSRLSTEKAGSVANHGSVIYATVCSGLTCYALNVNEVATSGIASISGLNFIGKLNDNGVLLPDNMIKIGDVLNLPSFHTGIITDIIRNDDGIIQSVEISEATVKGLAIKDSTDGLKAGGLCIRKGWTRSQLFGTAGSEWGNYSVYRYTGTVPYTPSPYVNVGDEFDGFRIEQYPIMPYEGEGFAYKTGYIPDNAIKLVIIQDGYSYARVFKDDVEITGSPFAVTKDAEDNINDISVTEIGAGNYTAYLCNTSDGDVTNLTYACHWTVE